MDRPLLHARQGAKPAWRDPFRLLQQFCSPCSQAAEPNSTPRVAGRGFGEDSPVVAGSCAFGGLNGDPMRSPPAACVAFSGLPRLDAEVAPRTASNEVPTLNPRVHATREACGKGQMASQGQNAGSNPAGATTDCPVASSCTETAHTRRQEPRPGLRAEHTGALGLRAECVCGLSGVALRWLLRPERHQSGIVGLVTRPASEDSSGWFRIPPEPPPAHVPGCETAPRRSPYVTE